METKLVSYDEMTDLPPTVYKYRSWTDNFHRDIIASQIVFMASPSSFEDLLDCKLVKRFDLLTDDDIYNKYLNDSKRNNPSWSRTQHRRFARDWFSRSPMRIKEQITQMQKKHFSEFDKRFGVLSLTANPRLYAMWEKYADQHRGFCVGFDSKKMFKHLGGGGEVTYYDKLPDILPFDSHEVEHCKQVFSKESKWRKEEEYRTHRFYPLPATLEERRIRLPKDSYREIIFGAYISEQHQQEIILICKNQNLAVEYYLEKINGEEVTFSKYSL